MKATRVRLFAFLTAVAMASSVFAQVSPQSPARDSTAVVTVEGRITKVEVTTPHITLYVEAAASESGRVVAWAIETGSLSELSTKGISRSDLRLGRVLRARGTPGSREHSIIAPVSEISFPQ